MSMTAMLIACLSAGSMTEASMQPVCVESLASRMVGQRGGGMLGDGWDGPGQHATTLYFHMDNGSTRLGASQRQTLIDALAAWTDVVQIHFVELPVTNYSRSIDFLWATRDHCADEPDECGDERCHFNGPAFGAAAHAFFPPGIDNYCGGVSTESRAGNIHFDDEEAFQTNPDHVGYSLMLAAAHMIGHALGLDDNPNPGDHDVMGPVEWNEPFLKISLTDTLQIQQGYAAGVGSVTTLEETGVWVNSNWTGPELGTPGSPFDSLAEGVAGVPPFGFDVTIHVLGGLYPGALTVSKPCRITSEFGTAYIGR